MFIEEILSQIDNGDKRSYYYFETFILHILKHHIESQEKRFSIEVNDDFIGDAYAKDGFDNFSGNTLIEIQYNLSRIVLKQFTMRLNYLLRLDNPIKYENILIITSRPLSPRYLSMINEELSSFNDKIKITVWGLEEINKIASKYRSKAQSIANNIFSLRLENAVNKEIGDWEKERDQRIELLMETYERGQFSLFLGAGISSSAGMPDWNTLLNSLFVSYLTKEFNQNTNIIDLDIEQIVTRLNNIDEPSALMAARYLRKGLSKETVELKEFTRTITENLYKLRNQDRKIDSDLIVSISNLCMPRRTGARVRSVITYNFDDLLERQLASKNIQHHSIYTDNETYDPDELPVYHVHGFLPEDTKKYERLDKSTLVFSEEGYHQIYSESYHWSNLVQLTHLRENNCLMIGLSMTDPNLRRLLDISARNMDRPKHFTFMRRMTLESFIYSQPDKKGKREKLITNEKGAEQFLNRHHKLNEEIMKELGVSIIWFNEFDEIPPILTKINDY